ncbi:hypothetical protein OMK64_03245 [Cellulomonas fimi]|uniref:hypothetical protein n=1 Tax=Cellulomonas fimi TaxID=1708 RepID=UPI00234CD9CC|nr:hypothetical protein [Cellulomonas fimi]MDC7120545.1 hypothetical protein [Cellulomonas fimi]
MEVQVQDTSTTPIDLLMLKPYISLLLLECTATDHAVEIPRLLTRLQNVYRTRSGSERTIVAAAVDNLDRALEAAGLSADDRGAVTVGAYISRFTSSPPWQIDGPYVDVKHSLTAFISFNKYVAIVCDHGLESFQSWLDKTPTPPYRRLESAALERAFLTGDAKSLWLDGVHAPRSTKASSKHLSGPQLQQALNPFDDPTFSLSAARAEIPTLGLNGASTAKFGVTPKNSTVWFHSSKNIGDFIRSTVWVLKSAIAAIESEPDAPSSVFPWLATRENSLDQVSGAFHVTLPTVSDVPSDELDPDLIDALNLLEDAELNVHAASGASLTLEVGLNGTIGGKLAVAVTASRSQPRMVFGWEGAPTDPVSARTVLNALTTAQRHVRVHYASGHAVDHKGIWFSNTDIEPFKHWKWEAFLNCDISKEKPRVPEGSRVHDLIGVAGDDSLFGWVVTRLSSGYLTCDDGAGEVGDFVHLSHKDELTLIHVKSASQRRPTRGVAVQRYEGVVGQAVKNLSHLTGGRLVNALGAETRKNSATWLDGNRERDRTDFLDYLRARNLTAPVRVVVLQPQVTQAAYADVANKHKVRLLDSLLHSARASAVGIGADLEVWSSV